MLGIWMLGMMQGALDMCIGWARQRVTFGRPIADRQAIQWMIVEIWTDIQYLRIKLYEAAWKADQGPDVRMEASLLKYTGAQ